MICNVTMTMKNKIFAIMGAGLLLMTISSCRSESDTLLGYDHDETLVFGPAETSFAAKFDVLWNGLSQYYALWDYEMEQGIDWDAVYDEYYPQFQALDQRSTVTDDELKALLQQVLDPLHDGHNSIDVKNHLTGNIVNVAPGADRLMARPDFEQSLVPFTMAYYANTANGEIETDGSGNPIFAEYSTQPVMILNDFLSTPGVGGKWIVAKIEELEAKTSLTDLETFQLQQLKDLRTSMDEVLTVARAGLPFVSEYNHLAEKYDFLQVPGFDYIDPNFDGRGGIDVKYALLKGNIAYFRLNTFSLTTFLDDATCQKAFDMSNPDTQQRVQAVKQVWQSWFNAVQTLHRNGTLGGVIIDLRTNGGGNMNDSKYVVGSLLTGNQIHFGYQRFKRGTGRLDYSPMMPAHVSIMSDPHEAITEPVVILANCQSVSMSETSVLCLKTMPNGTFIGKRTFGAICALVDNDDHSFNYSGYIGVEGVTPVYAHLPSMASYTLEKKLIEAEGIHPDIEVDLDVTQYTTTGKDTQLDRALQFIRTGN